MQNKVDAFSLAKDHLRFYFKSEKECDAILHNGPWVVAGQPVAMEPWVPDFVMGVNIRGGGLGEAPWYSNRILEHEKALGHCGGSWKPITMQSFHGPSLEVGDS